MFIAISHIFLKRAQADPAHTREHVRSALKYRDKAVPIASDQELGWYSMNTVKELAAITEMAGDLSTEERCVQYRNSLRLRKVLKARLQDKAEEIARRIVAKPEDLTVADVQCLSDQNNESIRLAEEKQAKLSCR